MTAELERVAGIPVARVKGQPYAMGRQLGAALAGLIRGAHALYVPLFEHATGLRWPALLVHARKYLPFVEDGLPDLLEELYGMADGAGLDRMDLFALNCLECLTGDKLFARCTTVAAGPPATAGGAVLLGHNEDWHPGDTAHVHLVLAEPAAGPAFLSLSYGAYLPNVGFNEAGLAQGCDTVYPDDVRYGVPRVFVARHVLGATTLGDAIARAALPHRAAGYNHVLASAAGEIYSVEVAATTWEPLYAEDGVIAHSNRYLSPRMQAHEADRDQLIRPLLAANRAGKLLRARHGAIDLATMQGVLGDHANHPKGVCYHDVHLGQDVLDRTATIGAMVVDLGSGELHACRGNPCRAPWGALALPGYAPG